MGKQLKALILEKESTDADIIVRELEKAGYALHWKRVANERSFKRQLDPRLDIIFLSIDTPRFSAIQALDIIAENELDIPVILVSSCMQESALECLRRGAVDYLLKDGMARLDSAVERALKEKWTRQDKEDAIEALRAGKQRFRGVAETALIGINTTDPFDKVTYTNPIFADMVGYSREELMGMPLEDIVHPEESAIISDQHASRRSGEPSLYETVLLKKDGQSCNVLVSAIPLTSEDGAYEGSQAVIVDITEQNLAKQEMHKSNDETARRQEILLALSQAAETVQKAESMHEIFISVGREIEALGFDTSVLLKTADSTALKIAHLTFEAEIIQKLEGLTGLTYEDFRIPLTQDSLYARLLSTEKPGYYETSDQVSASLFPKPLQPLAPKIASILGMDSVINAPLVTEGRIIGLLLVSGEELRSDDIPAIMTFANQVANALENTRLLTSLNESEERYRSIVEGVHDAILVEDLNGFIVDANSAACRMYGWDRFELIGKKVADLVPESQEIILPTKASNGDLPTTPIEAINVRSNGELFPVEITTKLQTIADETVMLVVVRDITERTKALNALRDSEARFSAVVESATDAIVTVDAAGEIQSWNAAAGEIFGYTADEVRGKPVQMLMPEVYRDAHSDSIERLASGGTPKILGDTAEFSGLKKNGELFPLELSLSSWEVDKNTYYTAMIRDITERKKTDQRVSQFSRIFESSLNEIYLFDSETLVFTQVNAAAQENLGYSIHEFHEMTPLDLKPEFTSEAFEAMIAPLRLGQAKKVVFETVHRRKDDTYYDVEVHLQLLQHDQAELFAAIILDITERKKGTRKIQRQVDQLEAVRQIDLAITSLMDTDKTLELFLENLIDQLEVDAASILLYDPDRDDLHCAARIGFRTNALEHTSLAPGSGYAGKVVNTRTAISRSNLREEIGEFAASPEFACEEFAFYYCTPLIAHDQVQGVVELFDRTPKSPDEEWVNYLDMLATQAAIAIVNNNLYTQVVQHSAELEVAVDQATENLHRSLDRQNAILNNSPDAILLVDGEGIIAQANLAVSGLLGYRPEELEGAGMGMLLDREARPDLPSEFASFTESADLIRREVPAVKKNGSSFDAELILTPIKSGGVPNAYVSTIRDVSEWTELQRMKDAFVSNVSHELRTPLTSLRLNYSLLRRDPNNPDKYLDRFERELDRLSELIEDLLRLSRLESGRIDFKIAPVDMNEIITTMVQDRTPMADVRDLDLHAKTRPDVPLVMADTNLFSQALSVLLTNALNYTPKGGQVELGVVQIEEDDVIWCGMYVQDDGPGIAPDDLPHLFERFFRGRVGRESGAPGTGLGLAIANEIMELHEGTIRVETAISNGRGARFTVLLPVDDT